MDKPSFAVTEQPLRKLCHETNEKPRYINTWPRTTTPYETAGSYFAYTLGYISAKQIANKRPPPLV